ncbi:MAG: hypothetical protein LBD74_04245 [Spirochaetaceae bacterium]|jgi:hypothetical protein|nr:hypothetical protein [Spirochaetaceae bacterium]
MCIGKRSQWIRRTAALGFLCALALGEGRAQSEREPKKQSNLGLGVEGNCNMKDRLIFGHSISYDKQLFTYFGLGFMLTISSDFGDFTSMESEVFGRWYFLDLGIPGGGLFLQEDMGLRIASDHFEFTPTFLGGISLGFRYAFKYKDYYVEPYIRGGYPFMFGVGLRGGVRL